MPEVVPVDDYVGEWYPGYRPELLDAPWVTERPRPIEKADESRFWFIDFHWPRGFSPMGMLYPLDCAAWGTQSAAQNLPLPPGKGLASRMVGTHIYESEAPVGSEWEIGFRVSRIERNLPKFLGNFEEIWAERVLELQYGLDHFESYDFSGASPAEIGQYLFDARNFHRRAWEIHFEIMYPLLAIYLQLYGLCAQAGLDPSNVSKFFQGRDSRIMQTDRAMWDLVHRAKALGLEGVFASAPNEGVRDALGKAGGNASIWLTDFDDFLKVYGWRTEGIADINLAPWIEDPTSPLGQIKNFLSMDEPHDFEKASAAAIAERDTAIDVARSAMSTEMLPQFNELLAINQVANFAWWNEDHNYYIDLRATVPLRRGCQALSAAIGADRHDDTLFLFYPEAMEIAAGQKSWADLRSLAEARRQYYDHYVENRPNMPKMLGTMPDRVDDPVLIEIFGMHHHYFEGLKLGEEATVLTGFAASAGKVQGVARVLHGATELYELEPGEILVCEATSPNWTPAFAIIGGCVCDGGGSLTHAAIVSREYGIPCVVGVGVATLRIKTGDRLEVDGTKGTVTILGG